MNDVKKQILEKSNDGLDILIKVLDLNEDVRERCKSMGSSSSFKNPNYSDSHASCFLFYAKQNEPHQWMMKDHGLGDFAKTWWQVYCDMRGLTDSQQDFGKNVSDLCSYMGYDDIVQNARRKGPETETRFATIDEEEGSDRWVAREKMTEAELRWLFGPAVLKDGYDKAREVAEDLGWISCASFSHTGYRNAQNQVKTVTKKCDAEYMVFVRSCRTDDGQVFYKIYRSAPESWIDKEGKRQQEAKCQYSPKGGKRDRYINGLYELNLAFREWQEKHKNCKLQDVTICSGERDALCCLYYGHHPVWFNSETERPNASQINELRNYCDKLYSIPDVDGKGIDEGTWKALEYIDIYTIWLNKTDMSGINDRGKAAKDFRDYVEQHPRAWDIDQLWKTGRQAQFWRWDKKGDEEKAKCKLLMVNMRYFLTLNGFWRYSDGLAADKIVRVDGYVVSEQPDTVLYDFVNHYVQYGNPQNEIVQELVSKVQDADLRRLPTRTFCFENDTPTSKMVFYENCIVICSAKGKQVIPRKDNPLGHYVWANKIRPRSLKLFDEPCHELSFREDDKGRTIVDLKINMTEVPDGVMGMVPWPKSNVQGVYINTSRTEWREDLLYPFENEAMVGMRENYRRHNRFNLFGRNLSPDQIRLQTQCYIAKVFATGLLLHECKLRSLQLAVVCMDNKIDEEGKCNGRSGKSFVGFFVTHMGVNSEPIDGKVRGLMNDRHVFGAVTKDTDVIFIDDIQPDLQIKDFYNVIGGAMTVNPKNKASFSIEYEDSPRLLLCTNFVFADTSPSTVERLQIVTFSDFYHGGNAETGEVKFGIREDLGMELLDKRYSDYHWNCDDNFMLDCLVAYFQLLEKFGTKIDPPMRNILKRQSLDAMGKHFHQWAIKYFNGQECVKNPNGAIIEEAIRPHLNMEVVKSEAYQHCISTRGLEYLTAQAFLQKLKAFADYYDYEFNPTEFCNKATDSKKANATKTLRVARMPGYDNPVEVIIMMDDRDKLINYFANKRYNVTDDANPLEKAATPEPTSSVTPGQPAEQPVQQSLDFNLQPEEPASDSFQEVVPGCPF